MKNKKTSADHDARLHGMPRLNGFKIIIIYTLLVFVTLCFVFERIFRRVRTFIIYTWVIFEFGRRAFRNVQLCRRYLLRFIYAIPVFLLSAIARVGRKQYQTIIIRPLPVSLHRALRTSWRHVYRFQSFVHWPASPRAQVVLRRQRRSQGKNATKFFFH